MTAFEEFGVMPEIGKAVDDMDWNLPTDVQVGRKFVAKKASSQWQSTVLLYMICTLCTWLFGYSIFFAIFGLKSTSTAITLSVIVCPFFLSACRSLDHSSQFLFLSTKSVCQLINKKIIIPLLRVQDLFWETCDSDRNVFLLFNMN